MRERYEEFWERVGFVVKLIFSDLLVALFGAAAGLFIAILVSGVTNRMDGYWFMIFMPVGFLIVFLICFLEDTVPKFLDRLDSRWKRRETEDLPLTVWDGIAKGVLFGFPWACAGVFLYVLWRVVS